MPVILVAPETSHKTCVKLYGTTSHKSTAMGLQLALKKLSLYSQYRHHGRGEVSKMTLLEEVRKRKRKSDRVRVRKKGMNK